MSDNNLDTPSETDRLPDEPMSLVEASQLNLLVADELQFEQKGVHLTLAINGEQVSTGVQIYRAYPLSDPTHYLSICDEENKEIGVLVEPEELSKENRALVEYHLNRRYLVPIVKRILSTKERFGTLDWAMETDRGECRFSTRNLREYSFSPTPGRLLIQDIDGNRYDIRDVNALDKKSQDMLYKYM
ncbi:MAG: DUF1854 domain-containing protein [Rhodothermaceae bacterium]|nr:DUF1854 domain-containing protein [Rhodothermaceae bacterium]